MSLIKRKSTAKAVLTNYHALKERRYLGDLDASDTLIDFERAVKLAKLTKRQAEALNLVYGADLTQKQACERLGIERSALTEHLRKAIDEIEEVYEAWAWRDGELSAMDIIEYDELEAVG